VTWHPWAIRVGAALLALGGVLALPAMIPRSALWRRASRFSAAAGALACLAGAVGYWLACARPPLGAAAGMLLFLAPAMALAYLVGEGLAKSREGGLPVLLLAAGLSLVGARGAPDPALVDPLPLPLRGPLPAAYAVMAFLAFGFLLAAGVQAAALLAIREFWPGRAERAGRAVYSSVCLGLPCLLLAMIASALWAQRVDGAWWGWSPRELWLLGYCLALLAYVNLHFIAGWRQRGATWFLLAVTLVGLGAFASLGDLQRPGERPAREGARGRPGEPPQPRPRADRGGGR
jgi:ABC-type transport system involved in cytochrome c biogenesis permease subunit